MKNSQTHNSVVEIEDIQGLNEYSSDMNSFLENPSVQSNPYHYPAYIKETVTYDNSIKAWKILLIKDSSGILSIIPLYVSQKKFPIKFALFNLMSFNISLLKLFGSNISYRCDADLASIFTEVNNQLMSAIPFDLGMIDALPGDSRFLSAFKSKKWGDITVRPISKKFDVVRYLEFPDSWDDYLSSMKRKRRYNLKRNLKILKDKCNGDVELKCFISEDQVEPFLTQMDGIYKNTWQSSAFGFQSRLNELEIKQNKSLAQLGCFNCFILFASQSPIAFVRGYLFKGKYYYEEIGYKQEWAKYNPGSVLNFLMLEQMMQNNLEIKELNFGYGENIYKQIFSNNQYQATNAYIYKRGTKGHIIFIIQQKVEVIYSAIRLLIIKLNLEVIIRQILRKKTNNSNC